MRRRSHQRKYWSFDGSGGNDHAVNHYKETSYPLAVKLGTITADGKGDVYSYSEDNMVEDPLLVKHLAHWGINVGQLEKTEKSWIQSFLTGRLKGGSPVSKIPVVKVYDAATESPTKI